MPTSIKRAALVTHGPLDVVGGVERFNQYLVAFLQEEGFSVEIYEPSKVRTPARTRQFLDPVIQYFYLGRGMQAHLQEYDLVVTTGFSGGALRGSNVMNISLGAVRSYFNALKACRHYGWPLLLQTYATVAFDYMSKTGKLCLAISNQVETELRHDYGVFSLAVPCGIDTSHFVRRLPIAKFRAQYGISPTTFVGTFVGRWDSAHKGLDLLVPIMKARTDVHWLIATDSAAELHDVKYLTLLRNVGYADLPSVYSAADFSIQLSRYESFGFSFVESLSCSVPVISTPVGIAAELYDDPLLRHLLIRSHGRSTADLLSDVHKRIDDLKNREYRDRIATRARSRVQADWSLEAWKKRMRPVIARVTPPS